MINKSDLQKGSIVYYCQVMPTLNEFNIIELKVRTVADTYFVGLEKIDKTARLFDYKDTDNVIFLNRNLALEFIKDEELKYKEDD